MHRNSHIENGVSLFVSSASVVVLAALSGFLAGAFASRFFQPSPKVLRAEAIELSDSEGRRISLGIIDGAPRFRITDARQRLRAELATQDGSTDLILVTGNQKFRSELSVTDDGPAFNMNENDSNRLGFGLQPDDTGSTSQQNWVFYSGAGGRDQARAIFGSGLALGTSDTTVRGFLDLCCTKAGSFWNAPPR